MLLDYDRVTRVAGIVTFALELIFTTCSRSLETFFFFSSIGLEIFFFGETGVALGTDITSSLEIDIASASSPEIVFFRETGVALGTDITSSLGTDISTFSRATLEIVIGYQCLPVLDYP